MTAPGLDYCSCRSFRKCTTSTNNCKIGRCCSSRDVSVRGSHDFFDGCPSRLHLSDRLNLRQSTTFIAEVTARRRIHVNPMILQWKRWLLCSMHLFWSLLYVILYCTYVQYTREAVRTYVRQRSVEIRKRIFCWLTSGFCSVATDMMCRRNALIIIRQFPFNFMIVPFPTTT